MYLRSVVSANSFGNEKIIPCLNILDLTSLKGKSNICFQTRVFIFENVIGVNEPLPTMSIFIRSSNTIITLYV